MRRYLFKVAAIMTMSASFSSLSHAIQVDVQTTSEGVYAVGFTVNGTQYGGPGKSFTRGDLPANAEYTFGVRIGGLVFGAEDLACTTLNGGHASVLLHSDTRATLMYDGNKKCYVETFSV